MISALVILSGPVTIIAPPKSSRRVLKIKNPKLFGKLYIFKVESFNFGNGKQTLCFHVNIKTLDLKLNYI